MATFALTGRATDRRGLFIERRDLISTLGRLGHGFHDKVYSYTDYLVASRTDTTKAAAAARNGTRVISYSDLWRLLGGETVQPRQLQSSTLDDILAEARATRDARAAAPRPDIAALAALDDTPPEPTNEAVSDRWNRVRKISV